MHVTALAPPSVSRCSVTLSGGPSDARFFNGAGGIRTHGLELMRLARTAPPLPREVWLAGVEPAISGAQNRRDGLSPTARGTGRGRGGARKVDDRGIEPRFTAVSERRLPSQPVVESARGVARESHPACRVHTPGARF